MSVVSLSEYDPDSSEGHCGVPYDERLRLDQVGGIPGVAQTFYYVPHIALNVVLVSW